MANTWRAFRYILDVSRFFSNIRRDILGNLINYEANAQGLTNTELVALAVRDANQYQRLLSEVKTRWDGSNQQKFKDSLTALGFALTDIVDEYQDLKAAADIQAAVTNGAGLLSAAVAIRASLPAHNQLM